ncbi:MAG: hypothetical protein JSU86_13915 [Phycisphaerales bacterium]|nr:MAG: hypothetical protein JSU86_13915 [Phycisphaerales bacterium]
MVTSKSWPCETTGARDGKTRTARHLHLCLPLALGLAPTLAGCAYSGGPWTWQCCYNGPSRSLAEIAVLLVAQRPLPLHVNSIDGVAVGPASEYHLLPGNHVGEMLPVSAGFSGSREYVSAPQVATFALDAGTVYLLTADVTWGRSKRQSWDLGPWRKTRVETPFDWTPRVEELGACATVARALPSGNPGPHLGSWPFPRIVYEPPDHWRFAASAEPGMEGRTRPALACPCVTQGSCKLWEAVSAGVVEAAPTEAGFNFVTLRIKRSIDRPVQVTAPVGPFLVRDRSAPALFALTAATIDLPDDEWHTLDALVARSEGLMPAWPSGTAFFADWGVFLTQCSAHREDFRKLLEALGRDAWQRCAQPRDAEQAIRVGKAVIWIVAVNADHAALTKLGDQANNRGPSARSAAEELMRQRIDETDAAMAMRLVDEAGIDIQGKAIWRDRELIARGVSDRTVRAWIEQREHR